MPHVLRGARYTLQARLSASYVLRSTPWIVSIQSTVVLFTCCMLRVALEGFAYYVTCQAASESIENQARFILFERTLYIFLFESKNESNLLIEHMLHLCLNIILGICHLNR